MQDYLFPVQLISCSPPPLLLPLSSSPPKNCAAEAAAAVAAVAAAAATEVEGHVTPPLEHLSLQFPTVEFFGAKVTESRSTYDALLTHPHRTSTKHSRSQRQLYSTAESSNRVASFFKSASGSGFDRRTIDTPIEEHSSHFNTHRNTSLCSQWLFDSSAFARTTRGEGGSDRRLRPAPD